MRNWTKRLYTPTYLHESGRGNYFLVDCWNHRLLQTSQWPPPRRTRNWETVSEDLAGPHSVLELGLATIVEDTGRHRVSAFVRENSAHRRVDSPEVGIRPHRLIAGGDAETFFCVTSSDPHLVEMRFSDNRFEIVNRCQIPLSSDSYVRSATLTRLNGSELWYFVSGPNAIVACSRKAFKLTVEEFLPVHARMQSMNDLFHWDNRWWGTATPGVIAVADSVQALANNPTFVEKTLGLRGTPYYLSAIQGELVVPEITEYSRVCTYGSLGQRKRVLLDSGPPSRNNVRRKSALPV